MRVNTELELRDPDKFSITTMVYSVSSKENNDSFDNNIRNSISLEKGVTTKEFLYGSK
ncbi:hypothetical protein NIES37_36800 [Tolypothrix tenuis PCC 7101]|uniref:Uncharacterized protein n=1 Tax=Tolypothrix tenuis PCC 7101 TaxID=231146 RepID=A0A1Z4N1U3_9CYAN|nr:hypothetical protein NIES37_36800 [Tolypothrix tenuis PCC 7101]BAZ76381.1 hypothetical protein NIES50_49790 [Aulosira laxa NIES-50]